MDRLSQKLGKKTREPHRLWDLRRGVVLSWECGFLDVEKKSEVKLKKTL